jgi:hypothetical protein
MMTSTRNSQISNQFDFAARYSISPTRYVPTNAFHNKIASTVSWDGATIRAGRLPYEVRLEDQSLVFRVLSMKVEDFGQGISVARISIDSEVDWSGEIAPLLDVSRQFRTPAEVPFIGQVFKELRKAVAPKETSKVKPSTRFMIGISVPTPGDGMSQMLDAARRELIAFHVGASRHALLGPRIVESVAESCEQLNAKASHELLVLNEQGGTYVRPMGSNDRLHSERYQRVADLLTFGSFMQSLLLSTGSAIDKDLGALLTKVSRLVRYPQNAFASSVSNRFAWEVTADSLHLRSLLDELRVIDGLAI